MEGTSRAGLNGAIFFRTPNLKTWRIAFTRLLAASGKASLRSLRTSTASVVIFVMGISRKNLEDPGAMGSLKVDSKISLRTCRVRGSRRLKSAHSEKYLAQSQRHVPAAIAVLVDVAVFPCASS